MSDSIQIQSGVSAIRSRLQYVRMHYRNVTIGEWMGLTLAILLPVLAVLFAMDNIFHLPMMLRIMLWLGMATGVVYMVQRAGREMNRGVADEELALRVEKAFPELNNELINSLLLSKEADDQAGHLVSAVVQSGTHDSAKIKLRRSVPKKKLQVFLGAALIAFAIMGFYAVKYPGYFKNALQRILVPVFPVDPLTLTKIAGIKPQNCNVLSGDDVMVEVALGGVIKPAEIGYKIGSGEHKIARMSRDSKNKKAFAYVLRQLTQDTVYYVKAGDAKSKRFTITVHERPALKNVKVRLAYPEYSGLGEADRTKLSIKALAGTTVNISAFASKPLKSASITFSGGKPQPIDIAGQNKVYARFEMKTDVTYRIGLVDAFGFENEPVSYDAEVLIDHPPTIDLIEPPEKVMAREDDTITFDFTAADDYGIARVQLMQAVEEEGEAENVTERVVKSWEPEGKLTKEFAGRYELPVKDLKTKPGDTALVFLRVEDWNDVSGPGTGESLTISISVASKQTARKEEDEKIKAATRNLAEIIQLQERNLRDSKALSRRKVPTRGYSVGTAPLKTLVEVQEQIRKLAGVVIGALKMENPIRGTLESLYNMEMVMAVKQLRAVEQDIANIEDAVRTESDILARLTARKQTLADSINRKNMQDIFTELDAIIAAEKGIRKATKRCIDGKMWNSAVQANKQDALSDRLAQFKQKLLAHASDVARSDMALAKSFEATAAEMDAKQIRQNMIRAAATIEKEDAPAALEIEDKIIADLIEIKKLIRQSVAERAEERLAKLKKLISKSKKKADRLNSIERKVKQISEELKAAKDLSEDDNEEMKKKVEEMDEIQDSMAEVVEKMAKDLHLFPDIPACNELVQKMREVYEDITQKPGSESAPAVEVAVERGDSKGEKAAKDAMKGMTERIADMEMWLEEAPENIAWKQESLDRDEIPDIPLVDLPEELEDLVGDLLEQEQEIEDEAQDSASNLGAHDLPAGWGVADGPQPSFGAKGKSGNTKPNKMEQIGRAGGGRQGMSNGEMVEGLAKDLEGSDVEVRRTNDPFQKGEVEEENPNSEAKATGGGKQSGQSDGTGLTGAGPPRNELGMRELERKQRDLTRNTEKIYSKAVMMYLPTGELDNALLLMQQAAQRLQEGDMAGFTSLQRRIVRALDNTQRELRGEAMVQLEPWMKVPAEMQEEMLQARNEIIPDEYKDLVSEYYKAIAGALSH